MYEVSLRNGRSLFDCNVGYRKDKSERYERKMAGCLRLGSLNTNSEIKTPVQEVYWEMLVGSTLVRALGSRIGQRHKLS